jgi:hypothetical protein
MELDEMKVAWTALDNRLKRNEELKESIILEMIGNKASRLINRFITWEVISAIGCFLCIPVCVYSLDRFMGLIHVTYDVIMLSSIIFLCVYPFWSFYKIHGLMKFDLTKNVGMNIYYVNKYNIQIKREYKIVAFFIGPVWAILLILFYASFHVSLPLWSFLFCTLIAVTIVCYWFYKKYDKNIASILRSLDEIKELQEE